MISFSRRQLAKYAVEELLKGDLSTDKIAKNLAATLKTEGKQKEVELLLTDIDSEMEQRSLVARAHVTSARPLPTQLKNELRSSIKKVTGVNQVILDSKVDESLIGGFKVETSTKSWDKSLKKMLNTVKETS